MGERVEWAVDMGFAVVRVPSEDEARRWVKSYEDHPSPDDDPMPRVVRRTVTTTDWLAPSTPRRAEQEKP